jgi:S1-C subfamily serine protease
LQSDLTIYPGFGGGPLVDAAGRIHGINSGGLSGALATTIPNETVNHVLKRLLEHGYVARGWLGAAMQPVRFSAEASKRLGLSHEGGLIILGVEADGPAANAGLLVGDVIVKLDEQPLDDIHQLLGALAGDVVGKSLRFDVVRGGGLTTVEVLVGERPRRRP